MNRSFRDPWTEAVFQGVQVSMLHPEISWDALRNLDAIDEAAALCD
jgi:plasmid maintenance system killer protein